MFGTLREYRAGVRQLELALKAVGRQIVGSWALENLGATAGKSQTAAVHRRHSHGLGESRRRLHREPPRVGSDELVEEELAEFLLEHLRLSGCCFGSVTGKKLGII